MQISGSTILASYQRDALFYQPVRAVSTTQAETQGIVPSLDDSVSISIQAQQLFDSEHNAQPLPALPEREADGVERYLALKKTELRYQVATDTINMVTGNGQGISVATTYTLRNNEQYRSDVVDLSALQNQASLFALYQEQNSEPPF